MKDEKFLLAPYVRVGFLRGKLFFGFGSIQAIVEDEKLQKCYLDAGEYLKNPRSLVSLYNHLIANGHEVGICEEVIRILKEKNLLIEDGVYRKEERHSRSMLFYNLCGVDPYLTQRSIEDKHIGIIGCGSIGNLMAVSLATAGVKKFTFVDGDNIEVSNLSRQIMFEEKNCGQSKVRILAESIRKRFSDVCISCVEGFANKSNLDIMTECDLLIVSGDQLGLVEEVNEFCISSSIPFINVGYIQDIAVWGPFVIPGETGCFMCQKNIVNNENVDSDLLKKIKTINKGYQSPSVGPVNMMAASNALLDVMKYLGNFGNICSLNKRIGIWTHNMRIEEQRWEKNPNCKYCKHIESAALCI